MTWQLHGEGVAIQQVGDAVEPFYEKGWIINPVPSANYPGKFDVYIKRIDNPVPHPSLRRVKPRAPIRSRIIQGPPARPGMIARPVRKRTPHAGVMLF